MFQETAEQLWQCSHFPKFLSFLSPIMLHENTVQWTLTSGTRILGGKHHTGNVGTVKAISPIHVISSPPLRCCTILLQGGRIRCPFPQDILWFFNVLLVAAKTYKMLIEMCVQVYNNHMLYNTSVWELFYVQYVCNCLQYVCNRAIVCNAPCQLSAPPIRRNLLRPR